jgi:spoIIIJ-associated protein
VETKREIESSGSSVEEAIAAGLEELGIDREDVEIEVIDEGSRGLLGIGSRPARVRLLLVAVAEVEGAPAQPPAPTTVSEPAPTAVVEEKLEVEEEQLAGPPAAPSSVEDELQSVAPIARQTLEELLEKMGISAQVEDYIKQPQDEDDYHKLVLNIRGQDLGILIGRRGETLDALQYITRLIVGREVERRVNLVVDVEGYRARRERSLRQLAHRMAERAVSTGRRQVLEPMPAAERRIVHVALRDNNLVETESIGQDENRKVTIFVRGSE